MPRRYAALGFVVAAILAGCTVEIVPDEDVDKAEAKDVTSERTGCMTHSECPNGFYCGFTPTTCGDQGGQCTPKLDAASVAQGNCDASGPICGCDGQSYPSGCEAALAGVSVWQHGDCNQAPPPPYPPLEDGCLDASDCGPGELCIFTDGSCGQAGFATGECRDPGAPCTSSATEVCGCDGDTYETLCEAVSAAMSVLHNGAC